MFSFNNATDVWVGGTAVTSPVWLQWATPYVAGYMLAGGAALLTFRLVIAWREMRRKGK